MMRSRSQHGMTLIEVTLAIGLIATITMFTWLAVSRATELAEESTARGELDRMGRNAIDIMRTEMAQSFISQNQTEYFTTVWKGVDRDPVDEVHFVARAHQVRYANAKEGDFAEYGYWSESDRRGGNFRTLLHRESPIVDDDPERGGTVLALSHSVRELNIRYFDSRKEEWVDDWDSESSETINRAPDAIEIRLELEDDDGRTVSFFTRTPVLP